MERLRHLIPAQPNLCQLRSLFHLWWKREQPARSAAVRGGLLGALPYLLRRQRTRPHAARYAIPMNIFSLCRHLVGESQLSEDGCRATISAVEIQQVVPKLTVMEIAQLAPPPAISDSRRIGAAMPNKHPRWDLRCAHRACPVRTLVLDQSIRHCVIQGPSGRKRLLAGVGPGLKRLPASQFLPEPRAHTR